MNKNSVGIMNSVIDMFLELELKASTHIGDNDMYFLGLSDIDKQDIISKNQVKIRKYYSDWRKRADKQTNDELEKEYGGIE